MEKQVTNHFTYFIHCLSLTAHAIEIIEKALKYSNFKAIASSSPHQGEKDVKEKQMIDVQGIL